MRIALLEPFYTGSHKSWTDEFAQYSSHEVKVFSLEGRYWKWRMHGAAVTFGYQLKKLDWKPDLILASDMVDLSVLLALIRDILPHVKVVSYFHENQLNYPWSPTDQDVKLNRDNHYAFINFTSALVADTVLFNSQYHKEAFLKELPNFLKSFPDYPELWTVDNIRNKSQVLSLGLDLSSFDAFEHQVKQKTPLILWNHRWEYDKNPNLFFQTLFELSAKGYDFKLAVLGEHYRKCPVIFSEAKSKLKKHLVQWGYVDSFAEYAYWLFQADVLPVTSNHDFFGASVVQAIYCGCFPLLPNRLAYPEHIPAHLHQTCLYESNESFSQKLQQMIINKPLENQTFKSYVQKYDWKKLINEYDKVLSQTMC